MGGKKGNILQVSRNLSFESLYARTSFLEKRKLIPGEGFVTGGGGSGGWFLTGAETGGGPTGV